VLLVVADDLGVDNLASYQLGNDLPSTPNLDALAARGVQFRNAYAYASCSPTRAALLELFDHAEAVLTATRESLDPDAATFPAAAHAIEAARDAFSEHSQRIRQAVNDRVAQHEVTAIAGIFFGNLTLSLDALVRHCRLIAREQQQPYFALKPAKLDRVEPPATVKTGPPSRGTGA
jgi:hypothetical protein